MADDCAEDRDCERTDPSTARGPAVRAGVVGLGAIGAGVAMSLSNSGRHPHVFDVRPDAAGSIDGISTMEASSAALARQCDVVLVAVVDADQARDVLSGPDGILAGAHPDLIVVLLSTVPVAAVHELATLCSTRHVTLLDCGVTPGSQAPNNGMVAFVGGADDAVARARPVLEDFARSVIHCGPLGAGMTVKIARNLITYCNWAVVDEAATLATANGVSIDVLLDALHQADAQHPQTLHMLKIRAAGITVPPDRVEQAFGLAAKDLDAATTLGRERGIDLPLTMATRVLIHDVYARDNAPSEAIARGGAPNGHAARTPNNPPPSN